MDKATLPLVRRLATETGMAVQHRQQGQANAREAGSLADLQGQLSGVGVGFAGRVLVHVMEFSDRGKTALEHFDVQLASNDAELFRADLPDQTVHQVAPGPETVVRVTCHFGQTGHGALKGMRMQIRHTRQQRPLDKLGTLRIGIDLDTGEQAIGADVETHIVGPTTGQ